jgi:hypothetical protein
VNKKILILILLFFFIFCSCSSERKDWEEAEYENTKVSYEIFLAHHPKGKFSREALSRLEKIYFEEAKTYDFISNYENFLSIYSPMTDTDEFRLRLERLYFYRAESEDKIEAYEEFLKSYPKGILADKARIRIEEIYFEQAQSIGTIPSYEDFLKLYPHGVFSEKSRLEIENIYKNRHPAFRNVKKICIIVNLISPHVKNDEIGFESTAHYFLKHSGLKVVTAEENEADAKLRIKANVRALSAQYKHEMFIKERFMKSLTLYSGASMSGTISLEVPGSYVYKKTFRGYLRPPSQLKDETESGFYLYRSPSGAPYFIAFHQSGSYYSVLSKMIFKIFGINFLIAALYRDYKAADELVNIGKPAVEPLIKALKNNETRIYHGAIYALGEIKDPRAIEPLIKALEDKDLSIREIAVNALERITEENFGNYPEKWLKWWEKNKEKYLEKK